MYLSLDCKYIGMHMLLTQFEYSVPLYNLEKFSYAL